jgi:hypothetical protein
MRHVRYKDSVKPRPWMRVQLQRDDDASCYESVKLLPVPPTDYVTVAQVAGALATLMQSRKLPRKERERAQVAQEKANAFVGKLPPGGWDRKDGAVSQSESFLFDRTEPYLGYRFDVENLYGHNVRS